MIFDVYLRPTGGGRRRWIAHIAAANIEEAAAKAREQYGVKGYVAVVDKSGDEKTFS